MEVLLEENPKRFVLFPIEYAEIWKMYKKHVASFFGQPKRLTYPVTAKIMKH